MSASSVELVTGPYRAGKSLDLLGRLVDYLAAAPLRSRPAILTVPSQRYKKLVEERLAALVKERGLSAASPISGLFGLKILPFYELCHFVLRQTGQSFRILPDPLRPAVLEKAISEVKAAGRLENLADVAHFPGTHAGILELIDELERAGYAPSEVVSILSRSAATNARYMELARIYEAYWLELERLGIYDERKLAYKTREILNNLDSSVLSLGFLAVDGFDRFNRLQLQVLSALSEQADRTVICFDYLFPGESGSAGDEDNRYRQTEDDYRWKEKSIRELNEIFGQRLQKIELPATADFSPAQPTMWRSLDRMMEMDEVVRSLKAELDAGLDPESAVVVVRSVKPYLTAIKAAFEKGQISYYLDEAIELQSVPLIKYLMRLLRLNGNDFVRQEVVRTLGSPFCNLEYLGLTHGDVEVIDDDSLNRLVVSGRADWLGDGAEAHQALVKFFDRLTPPAGVMSFTAFVSWVEDIIDDLLILPNDDEYADPLVVWEENQALFEFRKVLSALILEENLVGLNYGDRNLGYESLVERLEKSLEQANFRRPNATAGAVTVCGADLVPNRKFACIFVAGLVEGEFPRKGEKAGFLSRDEVHKWMTYGIDIENPRSHDSFEISLYKSLLERATDSLFISSPLFDVLGEELTPSFFISQGDDNVLAQVPYIVPNENAVLQPVSSLDLTNGVLWYTGGVLPPDESGVSPELTELPELSAIHDLLEKLSEPLKVVKARSMAASRGRSREWNGDISEQVRVGGARVDLPDMWSVSKLNDFGKCPFRFWVSNVLEIDRLAEPEAGLDALLKGQLYHKVLEYFYSRLNEAGLTIVSPDGARVRDIFEQSIADAIHWLETEKPFKQSEFWQYEKNELYFRLRRFFEMELTRALNSSENFRPVLLEKAFGFESREKDGAPALVIKSGGREVKIRGFIDRLDLGDSGTWRVVDYKSGAGRISEKEAIEGRNMQLPIYALAVQRSIQPGATVSGGSFLSISSGEKTGSIDFERNEIDVISIVEENIVRFVEAAARGNFSIKPSSPDVCNTCDHFQVCRVTELKKTGGLGEREAERDGSRSGGGD
ncbi:MAG: PD-(D/E)XK nuclease family protein [Cyanobacteria bacterium SZAS LIN-3]|nr:PD-(D/E)XK nuclease family protein [Cyanobacteria bacterium SZAS LIN-3]